MSQEYFDHRQQSRPTKEQIIKSGLNLGPKIESYEFTDLTAFVSEMNRFISCVSQNSSREVNISNEENLNSLWQSFTTSEKQFVLDVFCWRKDEFSVEKFSRLLPQIIQTIKNNPSAAFVLFNSYEFHLFLKSKYNFYPFDQEEANYPNDDHYFLSKDFSYVFHYAEYEKTADEVEEILDIILQVVGSEYFISKLQLSAADSYLSLEEDAYSQKKSRLESSGYPSYEDALEWQVPFLKNDLNKNMKFISSSIKQDHEHEVIHKKNSLPSNISEQVNSNFSLVKSLQAIFEFKKSNLNGNDEIDENLMKDSMNELLYFTKLGKGYLEKNYGKSNEDFKFLYRLGKTLFKNGKDKILEIKNEALKMNIPWIFFGETIGKIADDILLENYKRNSTIRHKEYYEINSVEGFARSLELVDLYLKNLDLIKHNYLALNKIITDSKCMFINFDREDVHIEAMIMTSFINYVLSMKQNNFEIKYLLPLEKLKGFIESWKNLADSEKLKLLSNYIEESNLIDKDHKINTSLIFLNNLMNMELLDLDFNALSVEDYKHIGSVLLVQ
jgi:hypothetical protein